MKNPNVLVLSVVAVVLLVGGYLFFRSPGPDSLPVTSGSSSIPAERLVRPYSPTLGPQDAPVTLVEFFDPACEACRAFYPIVKDLMNQHSGKVRLVLRYATFHQGSDQVVRLLEAAKQQNKYWEVLEALLMTQPMWADHHNPSIDMAYQSARQAGLDIPKAIADGATPQMDQLLVQEREDLVALQVDKTPTFFVNGARLMNFGPEYLSALVAEKMAQAHE